MEHSMHRLDREALEISRLADKMATDNRFVWDDPMTLFFRYALMKQHNMPPVNHKLHPEKHFAWDFEHNWPLASGTSLNDRQYTAIEAILEKPQVAGTCYCGNNMPYGSNEFGFFCSEKCQSQSNHIHNKS
jgi:hypothetical protein